MNYNLIMNFIFANLSDRVFWKEATSDDIEYLINNGLGNYLPIKTSNHMIDANTNSALNDSHITRIASNNRISHSLVKEMQNIADYLDNNNINYLIVKGPILSTIIYDNPIFRKYGDIDIVLLDFDNDCLKVLKYLKQREYVQNLGWGQKKEINTTEIIMGERFDHHEIKCVKGIADIFSIEIKNALSAIPQEIIGNFSKSIQDYCINGKYYPSFDFIHTFIVLCSNVFLNSESRSAIHYRQKYLKHYCDLYFWIKKYHNQLDCKKFIKLINKYGVALRVIRVFVNLISLLTYNEEIATYNRQLIVWLEGLIKDIKQTNITLNEKCTDVFLDNIPSKFEIINWDKSFLERIFSNWREANIINYKKHAFDKCPKKPKNISNIVFNNIEVKKISNKYYLFIDKEHTKNSAYKIELLTSPFYNDAIFIGFIINTALGMETAIFNSNAKHYDIYTGKQIQLINNHKYLYCDISELVEKSVYKNNIIFRLSKVKKIFDDVYTELDSVSYRCSLEV